MKKELIVKNLHFMTQDNQKRQEEDVRIEICYDKKKERPWEEGYPYTVILNFTDGSEYRASFEKTGTCENVFVGVADGNYALTILNTPDEFMEALWKCKHPYSIEELESLLRSVVDYEAEEGEYARRNLADMGFSEEQMDFFGLRDEA